MDRRGRRACDKLGELGAVGIGCNDEGSVRARLLGEGPSVPSYGVVEGGRDLSGI